MISSCYFSVNSLINLVCPSVYAFILCLVKPNPAMPRPINTSVEGSGIVETVERKAVTSKVPSCPCESLKTTNPSSSPTDSITSKSKLETPVPAKGLSIPGRKNISFPMVCFPRLPSWLKQWRGYLSSRTGITLDRIMIQP